jgi:hypothetical protein
MDENEIIYDNEYMSKLIRAGELMEILMNDEELLFDELDDIY